MNLKNKIEMAVLGYTVYADNESLKTTLSRVVDKFIFQPIRENLKIGKCYVCGRWSKNLEYVNVDAEEGEDGIIYFKDYVCENCAGWED